VPDKANTDTVSSELAKVALMFVGSPQAVIMAATHIVATRARRAFMQMMRQMRERRGCFSIIPRNLRQFKRLPRLTSHFAVPSFATSSHH
jgi:hypothetical protein